VLAPDQALDREHRVLRVRQRLPLGHLADQAILLRRDRDDRGRGPAALGIWNDDRPLSFEESDTRVGGAEIDTDGTSHPRPRG
jgi:hypothetical protein